MVFGARDSGSFPPDVAGRARLPVGLVLAALLAPLLAVACAKQLSIENRPCPCTTGYVCCPSTNRCVSDAVSCPGADAGPGGEVLLDRSGADAPTESPSGARSSDNGRPGAWRELCAASTASLSTCSDGVKDGDETDVDCGGSCRPCVIGQSCSATRDCADGRCAGQRCLEWPLHCANQATDEGETAIDCGGADCPACADQKRCLEPRDCLGGYCLGGRCRSPIEISVVVNGKGSVTVNPGGAVCSSRCTYFYEPGPSPSIELEAQAAEGWAAMGWGGCKQTSDTTCELGLSSSRTVGIFFQAIWISAAARCTSRAASGGS